jgi:hypothetical protein
MDVEVGPRATQQKVENSCRSPGQLLVARYFACAHPFLGFVAGSGVMPANAFPSGHLTNADRGGRALAQKARHDSPDPSPLWRPARTRVPGVTNHDAEPAHAGYPLHASGHARRAPLVSMAGEVLHEWHLDTLITESEGGRLLEVAPDRRIVSAYVGFVRGGESDELIPLG